MPCCISSASARETPPLTFSKTRAINLVKRSLSSVKSINTSNDLSKGKPEPSKVANSLVSKAISFCDNLDFLAPKPKPRKERLLAGLTRMGIRPSDCNPAINACSLRASFMPSSVSPKLLMAL